MNEPEDPESPDEKIDGSDAVGASVPWYLPGQEELDQVEELQEPELAEEEAAEPAVEAEVMVEPEPEGEPPLRIWCPDCGQELNISREHLGMQGMCLNCSLPIMASMRPDENGSMRVQATRVPMAEDLHAVEGEDSAIVEEGGESLGAETDLLEDVESECEAISAGELKEDETALDHDDAARVTGEDLGGGEAEGGTGNDNDDMGDSIPLQDPDEGIDPLLTEEQELAPKVLPVWMEKSLESQQEQEISIVTEGEDEADQEDEQEVDSDWDLNLGEGESEDPGSGEIPVPSWMEDSKQDEEGDDGEREDEKSDTGDLAEESEKEVEQEEKSQAVPIPSWMKNSGDGEQDEEVKEEEGEDTASEEPLEAEEGEKSDDDDLAEELEQEGQSQPVLIPPGMKSSDDGAQGEDGKEDEEDEEAKDGDGPSWAKGGNPWDALGLSEKKEEEDSLDAGESEGGDPDVQDDEEKDGAEHEPSLQLSGGDDESNNQEGEVGKQDEQLDSDGVEPGADEETSQLEEKESRMGLIMAAVIILVVGGGALALVLNPGLIGGKSSPKTTKDKQVVEKPLKADEAAEKEKADKLAAAKLKEKAAKQAAEAKAEADEKTEEDKGMKVAGDEPKAVERPQGQQAKKVEIEQENAKSDSKPQPKMATARPDIHDEVALRVHQEGERAIRRFYRTPSVEERSAFVLQPDRALPSMRAFYGKTEKLPTLRYVEFRGKVKDPTSGYRFGIFDVYEKENEKSHRWCVVEIEPGQYALDWGLYEQLESSTLVAYLAKVQAAPKKFRFLMKLGDVVSVMDSPWNEEAIKVYLKLPAAGGAGGEVILVKKSAAEKFGMLEELANGRMKIGQVELNWVPGDKDPGSKVPTIAELEGWGAWKKIKMRGLK